MNLLSKTLLLAAILILPAIAFSQSYDEFATQIRAGVWAWDKPEFKNYNIPTEYKDESAVILARHQNIEALSKNKIRFSSLNLTMNRELYYTSIDRQMVKINDKVSLEEYSSLSFKEELKTPGFARSNKYRTVVGVRIIKPDGTIKDVNVDDESVSVTEGKKDQEAFKKLAVSDLQVGDIIDYFICEYAELEDENVPPHVFLFYAPHPILSYSVHVELSRKLTAEYSCLNGAPDFNRSEASNEKDYILDAVQKNLPKIESGRWSSPYRDLPIIRLNIFNNKSKLIYKLPSARGEGIYKLGENLNRNNIIDDATNRFYNITLYNEKDLKKEIKDEIKKNQKENPNMTNKQIAQKMYDYLCLKGTRGYYTSARSFMATYKYLLDDLKIPHQRILVSNKYAPRLNDILSAWDVDYMIYTEGTYYSFPYGDKISDNIDPDYQGQDAYVFADYVLDGKKLKYKEPSNKDIKIPESSAEDNKSSMKATISFADSDPLELIIDREEQWSGSLKRSFQQRLVSYDVWDETLRKQLGIEESLTDEMKKKKEYRKDVEKIEAIFEERREAQTDSVKSEIYAFHNLNAKEVISYELINPGYTNAKPNMIFKIKYSIDGLVKKAGDNLILDAGKLIGQQWVPDDKDRRRTVNAYLPTARIYENEINVQIPAGYNVQGIDNLTKSVDNEYASFSSSASVSGNILSIKARKVYKKSFIPVAEWNKLLAMLDKTNEFYAQSVILKKK